MEILRTFDLLEKLSLELNDVEDIISGKVNKKWVKYSVKDYVQSSNYFSYGLLKLGIKKHTKIATVLENSPKWNIIDMGISQIGGVHVPIYSTISDADYTYILEHCDTSVVIIENNKLLKRLSPIIAKIPKIELIISIEDINDVKNFSDILALGETNKEIFRDELISIKKEVLTDDLVTIIYTSGTTGTSKGVMLTHKNLLSNSISAANVHSSTAREIALSFLPLCHVFERMMNYSYQYLGVRIYYAENMATIVNDLQDIKPHSFNTVPRLLEKIYEKIMAKGSKLTGFKKKIFTWAINVGLDYKVDSNSAFYKIKLSIARKLVFSKWQEALGGNIKLIVCGGSALQVKLASLFWAAGLKIAEGYGLSETSPVIAVNYIQKDYVRLGTVGTVLSNVSVKIANDGEILCKGPNVMKGYYKDSQSTNDVIDKDGWFHTGDIGVFEADRFLKITDRKKEMFKMSSGKYIAPQTIENKFKESLFIEQLMVVGENQKFASAIISPNFEQIYLWAEKNNITYTDNKDLITNSKLLAVIQKDINTFNKVFGTVEHIKRFRLVSDEWSTESGALSPTMKLKRRYLFAKYDSVLKEIYSASKSIYGI